MSYSPLLAAFDRLDEILTDRFPAVAAVLRPGASDHELDEFEAEFGAPLPAEFRLLYRWHDGADYEGYFSLPGIGHWRPLFMLAERCLDWQASWYLGFNQWWIPFTQEDYGQTVFAIDASQAPDVAAAVVYYEIPYGVAGRCDSVTDMINLMIAAVEDGSYGPNEYGGYGLRDPTGGTALTYLFETVEADDDFEGPGPPDRFGLRQRFDHDLDVTTPVRDLYLAALEHVGDLAAFAARSAGRDARAALPGIEGSSTRRRAEADQAPAYRLRGGAGGVLKDLDLLWRLLERNVDSTAWHDPWKAAERSLLSLWHRDPRAPA